MDKFESVIDGMNLSTLSIPSIRISDIIDIALVAIVIYILVRWIKQTRAWSLFRGLLVIALFSLLSYKLHFYTMTFLIEKTFSVGVIAFIVIFQPELRKALEQIGTGSFTNSITDAFKLSDESKLSEKSVDEIVNACVRMSDARIGALIVIENNVPTGEFSQKSGTLLDCMISEQVLINIFWKNTPLHDGALIIRNDRVAAAACVLPSTEKPIGGELGTRHRAAVGASEVTDATVIVVSEETGSISAATAGGLRKNLSINELRAILLQLVDNPTPIRKRMKGKGRKKQ
jgi:diadenylate cyclase